MTHVPDHMEPGSAHEDVDPSARCVDQTADRSVVRIVMLAFALSGMSALVYEVVWTRQLSLVFGSTVYAVSTMLSAFMTGLSIGGFVGGKRADAPGSKPLRDYMFIELLIGLFGMLTIPLMKALPPVMFGLADVAQRSFALFLIGQFAVSFLIMIVPTTLMGATFPIVSRIVTDSVGHVGRSVGGAYSVNTLGSIFGSAGAGFLLIPLLGVRGAVVTAVVVNVASALLVSYLIGKDRLLRTAVVGAASILVTGGVAAAIEPPVYQASLLSAMRTTSYEQYVLDAESYTAKYDNEGVFGRVSVLKHRDGYLVLQNGPMIEGSTRPEDINTTSLLSVLPYEYARLISGREKLDSALVVGLGTGFTAKAMLDLPVAHVRTVEIDPSVVEASAFFVGDDLKSDDRWSLTTADARWFISVTDEEYDVITSEPSWPVASAVTPLFTQESYENTRERLSPDGVFVQWLPRYLLQDRDLAMMFRTFSSVFPNNAVWTSKDYDLLLIGTRSDIGLPDSDAIVAAVEERLGDGAVALEPFPDTALLESAMMSDGPVNTDDHPILESAVARNVLSAIADVRSTP